MVYHFLGTQCSDVYLQSVHEFDNTDCTCEGKVEASDTVMINHVLHDYAERVSNAARHHSMRLCWYTTSWVHNAVMYICKVFMNLIILTVLVKVEASDTVMINHVLHDYAERVSNAARHHSMRLCWHTTSWVHNAVMYV